VIPHLGTFAYQVLTPVLMVFAALCGGMMTPWGGRKDGQDDDDW